MAAPFWQCTFEYQEYLRENPIMLRRNNEALEYLDRWAAGTTTGTTGTGFGTTNMEGWGAIIARYRAREESRKQSCPVWTSDASSPRRDISNIYEHRTSDVLNVYPGRPSRDSPPNYVSIRSSNISVRSSDWDNVVVNTDDEDSDGSIRIYADSVPDSDKPDSDKPDSDKPDSANEISKLDWEFEDIC